MFFVAFALCSNCIGRLIGLDNFDSVCNFGRKLRRRYRFPALVGRSNLLVFVYILVEYLVFVCLVG